MKIEEIEEIEVDGEAELVSPHMVEAVEDPAALIRADMVVAAALVAEADVVVEDRGE